MRNGPMNGIKAHTRKPTPGSVISARTREERMWCRTRWMSKQPSQPTKYPQPILLVPDPTTGRTVLNWLRLDVTAYAGPQLVETLKKITCLLDMGIDTSCWPALTASRSSAAAKGATLRGVEPAAGGSHKNGLTRRHSPAVPQMGRSGSVRWSGRSMVKALALRASRRK
jgi:hypothetical protein